MKKLIELLNKDENFRNGFKEYFKAPFMGIISKGKPFNPKTYKDVNEINKSLIGHLNGREFAIAIYKDNKFYTVYIPNIEHYGYLDYTIEETVYFEIFGYAWTVVELTKSQEEKIWNAIKDYEFENNIVEEIF